MERPPDKPRTRKRLTDDQVREIKSLHSAGVPGKEIAYRLGVSNSCVSLIVRGKRHAGK